MINRTRWLEALVTASRGQQCRFPQASYPVPGSGGKLGIFILEAVQRFSHGNSFYEGTVAVPGFVAALEDTMGTMMLPAVGWASFTSSKQTLSALLIDIFVLYRDTTTTLYPRIMGQYWKLVDIDRREDLGQITRDKFPPHIHGPTLIELLRRPDRRPVKFEDSAIAASNPPRQGLPPLSERWRFAVLNLMQNKVVPTPVYLGCPRRSLMKLDSCGCMASCRCP
ncbi:uncharacterized protein PG986_013342 [Apiospora aurea]|uniref:Uncharacterized protein n=1 Tax=Apiospora aurea TaxID=335848 RepID=A0ABR1PWC3_9PEZI